MSRLTESQLAKVRAGFILQGRTLKSWCSAEGVDYGYAHQVVDGKTNGPKAKALRSRMVAAATASPAA